MKLYAISEQELFLVLVKRGCYKWNYETTEAWGSYNQSEYLFICRKMKNYMLIFIIPLPHYVGQKKTIDESEILRWLFCYLQRHDSWFHWIGNFTNIWLLYTSWLQLFFGHLKFLWVNSFQKVLFFPDM